jgi:Polysaccharide pyruvyl transferase
MIGQLCTCDVDNFGDLLYPVVFRKMAEKHGISSAIVPLSFFQGPAPCDSGYVVQGINEVIKSPGQSISHLVIGGGDILRTDVNMVATHYCSIFEKRAGNHFLFRMKKTFLGRQHLRNEFIKQYMGYSPIAPFILDKANYSRVGSIVYCSCGVPFRFPPGKSRAIREAFEAAAFVYVRDFPSRDKLREVGVNRDIEVSPDLIVTLSDFFARDEERLKGAAFLAGYGVDIAKDIICFQSCPQSQNNENELLQQLTTLKKKTGAEIVLLPIGYCHGDDIFLRKLAERSGGSLIYIAAHSIYATISVLAACKLFVGTSMHGNITAFSFGIPHLFGPIAVDKAEGFLDVVGLGADFKLESWSQLADKQAMVMRLPQDYFATRAEAAKKAVYTTFGSIVEILKDAAPQPNL